MSDNLQLNENTSKHVSYCKFQKRPISQGDEQAYSKKQKED